ncbi:hypothetical protein FHR99_000139 [Litorivivens lipolytica]|uniref:CENP-V/GFA domain-containing protein n=1 Tax=Litorivivens lipolytica TaxID=1524264 RepID=A0A7W4Z4A8_9GAMM|nr:DUF6151 family protein [Litorivivens lipolytica]MBB3045903.1 hypothetical protein [Litorivivens lipolytica]
MPSEQKLEQTSLVACDCGQVAIELQGRPILVSECLCNSCREAASRLASLPGAKNILTSYGATGCAEYRKDCVRFISGAKYLREFRLTARSGTRRVIASCCNTPVLLELKGAHWLSIYLHLWKNGSRPVVKLRTMTGDLDDASILPSDVQNLKTHSLLFYVKLLGAWIKMGFKNPTIEISGKIEA